MAGVAKGAPSAPVQPPPLPSSAAGRGLADADVEVVFEGIELATKRYRHITAKLRALRSGAEFANALAGIRSEQADVWRALVAKKKTARALIDSMPAERRGYYVSELTELQSIYRKVDEGYWVALAAADPTAVSESPDKPRAGIAGRGEEGSALAAEPGGGVGAASPPPAPTTPEGHLKAAEREVQAYGRVVAEFCALKYDDAFAEAATELISRRTEALVALSERRDAAHVCLNSLSDPQRRKAFERDLAQLSSDYREHDDAFWTKRKAAARAILLDGALAFGAGAPGSVASRDGSRPTNSTLLAAALAIERRTTKSLLDAARVLRETHETAIEIGETLVHDHETIDGIDKKLDEVESELSASRKHITLFVKGLFTDKIIIALTALVVLGIVGLVVYSVLNPSQQLTNL